MDEKNIEQDHLKEEIKKESTKQEKTMEEKITRINELYHFSQERELTAEEKEEQARLRQEYILSIRNNLQGTLNQISILNPDGTVTELRKKNLQ